MSCVQYLIYVIKDASYRNNYETYYGKLFGRVEFDDLVVEYRQEVLFSAYYFPVQLKFSDCQKHKFYNSNSGRNVFGVFTVAKI